jgi:hypothetical protein
MIFSCPIFGGSFRPNFGRLSRYATLPKPKSPSVPILAFPSA